QEMLRKKRLEEEKLHPKPELELPKALSRSDEPAEAPASMPPPPSAPAITNSAIKTFRDEGENDLFDMPRPSQTPAFASGAKDSEEFYDPMKDTPHLNGDTAPPNEGFISHAPDLKLPAETEARLTNATTTAPVTGTVDNARGAVQNAFAAAPYDESRPQPLAGMGSQPMAEFHQPAPPTATPAPGLTKTPAPPVPPPLPFVPAPAPTPTPSPAHGTSQSASPPDPNSPNQAWPL